MKASGLRRDARSGVRTSVAILEELSGWVDVEGVVCGGRWVWGGLAEEGSGVVEQDWGIDGGVGNVCSSCPRAALPPRLMPKQLPHFRAAAHAQGHCFFKLLCVP